MATPSQGGGVMNQNKSLEFGEGVLCYRRTDGGSFDRSVALKSFGMTEWTTGSLVFIRQTQQADSIILCVCV